MMETQEGRWPMNSIQTYKHHPQSALTFVHPWEGSFSWYNSHQLLHSGPDLSGENTGTAPWGKVYTGGLKNAFSTVGNSCGEKQLLSHKIKPAAEKFISPFSFKHSKQSEVSSPTRKHFIGHSLSCRISGSVSAWLLSVLSAVDLHLKGTCINSLFGLSALKHEISGFKGKSWRLEAQRETFTSVC